MSEPFLERLSRFTPDVGGLDRDALLFAAGRASARPNRGWMMLAGLLAGTQGLSLLFLMGPLATPPGGSSPAQVATAPAAHRRVEAPASPAPAPAGLWSAHPGVLESAAEHRPDTGTFVESGPPLRASGALPRSLAH